MDTIPQSDVIQRQGFRLRGVTQMPEEKIGTVSDFFARPVVAAIELEGALKVGDKIHIKGHTTDLVVTVESMQIDNAAVQEAGAGDSIGVKVTERVRHSDSVYKVTE
jgi:putative protease